jgi:aminoglycoside phosphotransferase (APT) family kinase protein
MPQQSAPGIVHGDYRLTNVMFAPPLDHIAAVVDWEMATLGDPLTDVGLLYVYHELASRSGAVMAHLTPELGFLSPSELVERYAAATGTGVDALDWYIALGYFKLSVIAAGIHARYLQNLTVGAGFEQFGPLVDLALDGARRILGGR